MACCHTEPWFSIQAERWDTKDRTPEDVSHVFRVFQALLKVIILDYPVSISVLYPVSSIYQLVTNNCLQQTLCFRNNYISVMGFFLLLFRIGTWNFRQLSISFPKVNSQIKLMWPFMHSSQELLLSQWLVLPTLLQIVAGNQDGNKNSR